MTSIRILGEHDNTRRADGKVGCDCTCCCGDDPWLREGKSYPCDKRQREQDDEAARKAAMAARITQIELAQLLKPLDEAQAARVDELFSAAECGWRVGFNPCK